MGMMMPKTIPLTQGRQAIVDDEDYPVLAQYRWHYSQGYACRMVRRNGHRSVYKMHWAILCQRPELDIDHINGDRLDNRRQNLRYASRSQNNANRHAITSSSGFKGVCWRPIPRRWKAYIKVNRKQIHLGYYSTPEEAAQAYNQAALQHYGAYAHLNEV